MMTSNVMRETTPLTPNDCFTIFSRVKKEFDFPIHYHEEYELNLILNAKGAKRIVGGHIEVIDDMELALIGPDLYHAWFTNECISEEITEITIQFHKHLFDDTLLKRNQLFFVKELLELSKRGIVFAPRTIETIKERIMLLDQKNGFDSLIELLSILNELSLSENTRTLSDPGFVDQKISYNSRRIEKVLDHMNINYNKQLTLAEVSDLVNMPEASFSRFIKKRTGRTFIDSLIQIRLGHASRMLIDSTATVAEIAYRCGFNNISNFNRIFKRKKLCAPTLFRKTYKSRLLA